MFKRLGFNQNDINSDLSNTQYILDQIRPGYYSIKDLEPLQGIFAAIDQYQLDKEGTWFGVNQLEESIYIIAFLLGDKDFIYKNRCMYNMMSDSGMTYYQLLKTSSTNNTIISDISSIFLLNFDNYNKINTEITILNQTYQICNIFQKYNYIEVNFTINQDKYISYSFINNNNIILLYYYKGFTIKNPDNFINYISINQTENKFIYSTKNIPFYKDVYPKLKINSELYVATRKSYVVYNNSNLANFNKFTIKLFNSSFKQILIDNLDYNINYNFICNCDLETLNFSCKCYYLRHPLNKFFQIDLFLKIGCYTPDFNKEVYI
jgi:hypothetical protein